MYTNNLATIASNQKQRKVYLVFFSSQDDLSWSLEEESQAAVEMGVNEQGCDWPHVAHKRPALTYLHLLVQI